MIEEVIANCITRAGNRCERKKRVGLWDKERCPETGRLKPFYVVKSNITEDRVIMLCPKCFNEVMDKSMKNFKPKKKKVNKEQVNLFGGS